MASRADAGSDPRPVANGSAAGGRDGVTLVALTGCVFSALLAATLVIAGALLDLGSTSDSWIVRGLAFASFLSCTAAGFIFAWSLLLAARDHDRGRLEQEQAAFESDAESRTAAKGGASPRDRAAALTAERQRIALRLREMQFDRRWRTARYGLAFAAFGLVLLIAALSVLFWTDAADASSSRQADCPSNASTRTLSAVGAGRPGGPSCLGTIAKLTITWSVEPRASVEVRENTDARVQQWRLRLEVHGESAPNCSGHNYTWSVRSIAGDDEPTVDHLSGCLFLAEVSQPATYFLHVEGTVGSQLVSEGAVVARVRDWLIVSIGDSVASGEGNPADTRPYWRNKPCHRSAVAGPRLAATKLEQFDDHSTVTFIHLACTGAWISDDGKPKWLERKRQAVLRKAKGGETELELLEAMRPQGRKIDAIMLSVGANDIGFAGIIKTCAKRRRCGSDDFTESVRERLDRLAGQYRQLAADPVLKKNAERVFVTEYFDPTGDAKGAPCAMRLPIFSRFGLTISAEEAAWARENVIDALNMRVRKAARANRWRFVGGIAEKFRPHGYCLKTGSYVVQLKVGGLFKGSDRQQAFHPNPAGQEVYANRLFGALRGALYGRGIPAARQS